MPDTNPPPPAPSPMTETRSKATKPASSAPLANQRTDTGRSAHFVLQGKGGVGKSFIASLISQYLADQQRLDSCYDTDPVNGSLQTVLALNAKPVELLKGDQLNVSGIDRLIETIVSAKSEIVVDNGAASFLPLSRYLVENAIPSFLSEHGIGMVLHTVVTGGGNGLDTLRGLDALIGHFVPGASVVVWVNEFFGSARFDGIDFEATNIYAEHREKIRGLIYLRKLDPVMFAPNLASMLERHQTFAEAAKSDDYMLMEKSRLSKIKSDIWDQLRAII